VNIYYHMLGYVTLFHITEPVTSWYDVCGAIYEEMLELDVEHTRNL
jgi:hypothetical protein